MEDVNEVFFGKKKNCKRLALKKEVRGPYWCKHPLPKQDGADDTLCLARYLYNIEVCKSLYSSLNIFEVTFRNAIDRVLCSVAGSDNWYDILNY